MNESNIRKLLKMYGASDKEIENFMKDLAEMPVEEARDEFDEDDEKDYDI